MAWATDHTQAGARERPGMMLILAPFIVLGAIVAIVMEIARRSTGIVAEYDFAKRAAERGFAERLKARLLAEGWSPPPASITPRKRTP